LPRYFFHTQTDTRVSDEEGLELADHTEARAQAVRACGEMIRDAPEGFWSTRPWFVTITDQAGLVLYEIYVDGTAAPAAGGD
jgi:hypothetical protein